jgi:two-component system phosphate regulon response regulator PhoB
MICYNLLRSGWRVESAMSGEDALEIFAAKHPDLILLDLMLPGLSGMEVCRRIRNGADNADVPVIMLTARGEENDIVAGLEAGADDYVTKPFSPRVLLARVAAVLRRKGGGERIPLITAGPLIIDPNRYHAEVNGRELDLTPTEFAVLSLLASRPGWVFSRDRIIDAVRGHGYAVTPRAVDVQVFGLRRKLGAANSMIETVRGVGYRLRWEGKMSIKSDTP